MSVVNWAQCERCEKWRIIAQGEALPETWFCELNADDRFNSCDAPEQQWDETSAADEKPIEPIKWVDPQPRKAPKESDLISQLRSLNEEQLKSYWDSIDWRAVLEDKWRPIIEANSNVDFSALPRWTGQFDDEQIVRELDERMRCRLPEHIQKQVPKISSLKSQYQRLHHAVWQSQQQ